MPLAHDEPFTFPEALKALRQPDFLKSPAYNKQQWRAVRVGCDPDIVEFERRFLSRFQKLGIPMFCVCAIRSKGEQQVLVDEGFSKDSPQDGLWPHMAFAVDMIHSIDLYDLHKVQWDAIGHIGNEVAKAAGIPIKWGGEFKGFWDPAHWELADWRERAAR